MKPNAVYLNAVHNFIDFTLEAGLYIQNKRAFHSRTQPENTLTKIPLSHINAELLINGKCRSPKVDKIVECTGCFRFLQHFWVYGAKVRLKTDAEV